MIVKWDNNANLDLVEYIENSKTNNPYDYSKELVYYVNSSLEQFPLIGKPAYTYKDIEIRQLVYNIHKIFYYINNDKIIIIKVAQTSQDLNNIFKSINLYFK